MNDRFTSHHPFSREQLEAYAKGDLRPEQQHDVELLLEESPLHREAVEGLRSTPASLTALDQHRPAIGGSQGPWYFGAGLLIAMIGTVWFLGQREEQVAVQESLPPTAEEVATVPAQGAGVDPIPSAEIQAAEELPESLQIGHEQDPMTPRPESADETREITPGPIEPRLIGPDTLPAASVRPVKASRQLLYLHDLKLVHPDELYGADPALSRELTGVPANYADGSDVHEDNTDGSPIAYTEFMDEALGGFSAGDHKAALSDLQVVLSQYPNDVNALFYAGLCSYNLGLFDRAITYFDRAEHHSIDSFDQEAAWYHALSVERGRGAVTAGPLFERIKAEGGFYAEKAGAKLGQ